MQPPPHAGKCVVVRKLNVDTEIVSDSGETYVLSTTIPSRGWGGGIGMRVHPEPVSRSPGLVE